MKSANGALDKGARQRLRVVRETPHPDPIVSAIGPVEDESAFVDLYRRTFADLVQLIERTDLSNRSNFFHAMRFLQLLGLSSEQVARHIDYAQENICRWMNGQRAPHPEVRRYFVDKCITVLREEIAKSPPSKFSGNSGN